MKILTHSDFIINAFQDFLKANLGLANYVGAKGKLVIEVSDSQIKGWFVKQGNKEKLKQISYQFKANNSR